MRKLISSLAIVSVLAISASANNFNTTNSYDIKAQVNNKKLVKIGAITAGVQHYLFTYLGKQKNFSVISYKHFVNFYDTLVYHKPKQFGKEGTTDFLPTTIFNDLLLYDDNGSFNKLKYSHLLQYQFIDTSIEILQAKGIPTNLTYTVQKIVGKTAVTITLNIQQILAKYAEFLMYLKSLSNNNPQKFNDIFQRFAVFLFYNDGLSYYKPLEKVINKETVKAICLTDRVVEDPFSPLDFVAMIFGDYRGYSRTFLSGRGEIGKFVNYVLAGEKEKAAKLFLNNKRIEQERNFYRDELAAAAKLDSIYIPLPDKFAKIIYNKADEALEKLPNTYKQEGLPRAKYIEGIVKLRNLIAEGK